MFSLQDLLGPQQGSQAIDQISQNVGADSSAVNTAIQVALPAILGGLANNAASPQGAESLNTALEEDHAGGGVLNNLGGLSDMIFGQGTQAAPPPQANAGGILGHILGGNQGQVAQQASERSGLNMGQVAQVIMFLAPIVMGYLGKQKQEQNVGADGLGGLLGGILGGGGAQSQQIPQQPQSSGNWMTDMATSALDRDRDGSSMDDIASMAFNYIRGK